MLTKKEKALVEKITVGGGATGVSSTVDAVGGTATLPNSNKNSEPMVKGQNPAGTEIEETDGENNVKATGVSADANKSTIKAKPSNASVNKEDIDAIFTGEELSEDFKLKATTLFESAIALKEEEIRHHYESTLDEEVNRFKEELAEKVDVYLSSLSKQWLKENEVAIVSSLKSEIVEGFISGLKVLFAEHYMDVPDEQVDVIESLVAEVEELKAQLNEEINVRVEADKEINILKKAEAIDSMTEGLTLTQIEKLKTISEGLEYTDLDTLKAKLKIVKENIIQDKSKKIESNILTETFDGVEEKKPAVSPEMARYTEAISRSVKL